VGRRNRTRLRRNGAPGDLVGLVGLLVRVLRVVGGSLSMMRLHRWARCRGGREGRGVGFVDGELGEPLRERREGRQEGATARRRVSRRVLPRGSSAIDSEERARREEGGERRRENVRRIEDDSDNSRHGL
jgi:hypothetical protein